MAAEQAGRALRGGPRWLPFLLALALAVTGCRAAAAAGGTGGVASSPPASPPVRGSGAAPTAPQPLPAIITTADNGLTMTAHVGQAFTLALGIDHWTVDLGSGGILAWLPSPLLGPGKQGMIAAQAAGTATLRATGTPNCAPKVACPMLAMVFSLTVVVAGT